MTYYVPRKKGMTNGQYVALLQSHLDLLYSKLSEKNKELADVSILNQVVSREHYEELYLKYLSLREKLMSYNLLDPRND